MPIPRIVVITLAALVLPGCALWPFGDDPAPEGPVVAAEAPDEPVIDAEVERRDVVVPSIDTENFEVGLYAGVLGTEDLQSDAVWGLRAAYHVTEDFFLEAHYARSKVSDEVRREIGQPFFPEQELDLGAWGVSVGYNFLPGEVFLGGERAWTSTMYLLLGAGNTRFNSENFRTVHVGFGAKVLPTDWLSLRLEARDNIWESDVLGSSRITHNFEFTLGFAVFF